MRKYILPFVLTLLAAASAAQAGARVAWRAQVVIDPAIHTQPGFPILCNGQPIDYVGVTLSVDGNQGGNEGLVRAFCTYDAGHEAACECASWEAGDFVAVWEIQLNYGFTDAGGTPWYWLEVDRADKVGP